MMRMLSNTMLRIRTFVLLVLAAIVVTAWVPMVAVGRPVHQQYLQVAFLDVGQGDAVLITSPDGYELLVDGGPDMAVVRELAKKRSVFDRSIDMIIATHPDTDHVAGLIDVLRQYRVGLIIETASLYDTATAAAFQAAAVAEGARIITAQAGQEILLGASTTVRVLSPRGDSTNWETNTASVVVQVMYGDTEFILTGDASQGIEEYLVEKYGETLESEVLKLGHHGSDTSSSGLFLETVSPQYAVVSAGKDNRYGHPHEEVLLRAGEAGAQILSTAEDGTITFYSDGARVWVE